MMEGKAGAATPPDPTVHLDALERTLDELEALEAIYGTDSTDSSAGFTVYSKRGVVVAARSAVVAGASLLSSDWASPTLEIGLRLQLSGDLDGKSPRAQIADLRCRLPPGYPDVTAAEPSVSVPGLPRRAETALAAQLVDRAREQIGCEAVMGLAQLLEEMVPGLMDGEAAAASGEPGIAGETGDAGDAGDDGEDGIVRSLGRRYIWCHHITDTGRRKDIVREAVELELGGFLKHGYPGVVIVEGDAATCESFTKWIKGDKSQEGGFGRQWGHHVRGELSGIEARVLPPEFVETDDMGTVARACKDVGLEGEFKEFVLQHKPG